VKMLQAALAAALLTGAIALPAGPASAGESTDLPPLPVIASFDVAGQQFRVRYTDPRDVKIAWQVWAGQVDPQLHPIGTIVYGTPDVNAGYSWHLDPVSWSEESIELCDGRPKDVERHAITSRSYCPWSAKLVALQPLG
jgi:hypothetical protein